MQKNLAGRQYPLHIYERVDYAEFNNLPDGRRGYIVLPPTALLLTPLALQVLTAFVGPTTAEILVYDDVTNVLLFTIDLTVVATTTIQVAGYDADGARYRFEVNKAGPVATAGVFNIFGSYLIDGRANEVAPENKVVTGS